MYSERTKIPKTHANTSKTKVEANITKNAGGRHKRQTRTIKENASPSDTCEGG